MRLNGRAQLTIPAALRQLHGLHEGDELDVVADSGTLRIVWAQDDQSHGQRLVQRMRGRATSAMSTGQLLHLLRDH